MFFFLNIKGELKINPKEFIFFGFPINMVFSSNIIFVLLLQVTKNVVLYIFDNVANQANLFFPKILDLETNKT